MGLFRRSRATQPADRHTAIDHTAVERFAATQQGFPVIQEHRLVGLLPLPDGGHAELWTVASHPPRDFATVVARPGGSIQWMWLATRPGPDGASRVEFFNDQSTFGSTHRVPPVPDIETWGAMSEQVVPALMDRVDSERRGTVDHANPPGGTTPASSHQPLEQFAAAGGAPALVAWRDRPDLAPSAPAGGGRIEIWDQVSARGPISYLHLGVGYRADGTIAAIAGAEVAPDLHDNCFLGLFVGGGHTNLGENDDVRDPVRFAATAERLLAPLIVDTPASPRAGDRPRPDERDRADIEPVLAAGTQEVRGLDEESAHERLRQVRMRAVRTWQPVEAGTSATQLRALPAILFALGATTAAHVVEAAATRPGDPGALFDAGYQLYDIGLPELAIEPLSEALTLDPSHVTALVELGLCLETVGRPDEAARLYAAHRDLVAQSSDAQGLSLHYSAMIGDLDAVALGLRTADRASPFWDRAQRRLARAQAIDSGRWTGSPLRRWEAILSGTVLLHLATIGSEEMNGRYAALFDDYARMRHVLNLAAAALARSGREVRNVVPAADRDSRILAGAFGTALGVPLVDWEEWSPAEAGVSLLVAFDGSRDSFGDRDLREEPSVVTFAYSLDWTRAGVLVPDLTGLLAQSITPPWGQRMRVKDMADPSAGIETIPADERDPRLVAADLIAASPGPEYVGDAREVIELVDRLVGDRAPIGLLDGARDTYFELDTLITSARFT
ncbi:hypothetical protein [Nocardioides panacisoli]|uniref:Tetratricopeptide repeat protein n=1 Tax=Nocardioides panacisoli TaxID=627624 RepID=A0ABP7IWR6_9ACTN